MYVRKKRNRSGSISVVVVDKSSGRYKEIHVVGTTSDEKELLQLVEKGERWISSYGGQTTIDFDGAGEAKEAMDLTLSMIVGTIHDAPFRILNRVYNDIGFNEIGDDVLRDLAIARICQPMSKVATVDYLRLHFDEDIKLHRIYKYMDTLYNTQREIVQHISVEHTMDVLGGRIGIVFYDVTTLYFESMPDPSDGLRDNGFSKDGKTAESQIVLGLLVSANGYPLSYSIFNGKQYEGYTMIPVIDDFVQRFNISDFVVVADSGLMSEKNMSLLESAGYKYIVGARIRSESDATKRWMLEQTKVDGICHEFDKGGGRRLILNYSDKRAKKDANNRKKGVERLRKAYAMGTITKDKVNRRGYNKFLDISKDITVAINEDKITDDARWDGLKGYITNTSLDPVEVINQYHGLWVVERAFRIGKNNLEMRPMFHFTEKRIEAHICICFIALKMYKELERRLKEKKIGYSVDKVLAIAKTVVTLKFRLPNGSEVLKTLFTAPEHQVIRPLLEEENLTGGA